MEKVQIYKKSAEIAKNYRKNVEKELDLITREMESLKNWSEYYKSSGLDGQARLFAGKEKNLRRKKLLIEKGIPYRQITGEQWDVLCSVFDRCVPAEEFSAESMPSEVVKTYLEAKEYEDAGVFDAIEVAYYDNDPLLIGKIVCGFSGDEKRYLLARWGDGLKPWEWFIKHYLCEKQNDIPSAYSVVVAVAVSAIMLTAYFLFLEYDTLAPFILAAGVISSAVSIGLFFNKLKKHKAYADLSASDIPSPFIR